MKSEKDVRATFTLTFSANEPKKLCEVLTELFQEWATKKPTVCNCCPFIAEILNKKGGAL